MSEYNSEYNSELELRRKLVRSAVENHIKWVRRQLKENKMREFRWAANQLRHVPEHRTSKQIRHEMKVERMNEDQRKCYGV